MAHIHMHTTQPKEPARLSAASLLRRSHRPQPRHPYIIYFRILCFYFNRVMCFSLQIRRHFCSDKNAHLWASSPAGRVPARHLRHRFFREAACQKTHDRPVSFRPSFTSNDAESVRLTCVALQIFWIEHTHGRCRQLEERPPVHLRHRLLRAAVGQQPRQAVGHR